MEITYNSTSFYLEPCNGGFLLIDAGWKGQLNIFLKKLHLIGVRPQQIQYILLTHHHHDHTAIVSELKELTGARLILYKDQLDYLKKGVTDYNSLKQYNKLLWIIDRITRPFIKYQYPAISPNEMDIVVYSDIDDYTLRNIGIQGRIVTTPGHSHDSISVLLDNGSAYVGDLVMNMPNMKLIGKIPFPIEAEDYLEIKQSLKKLLDMGTTIFYPSHGYPILKIIVEEAIK